ncbi:glycerol-3-phosphate 1-O-acyltransferase PlsY [candidate division WOR-3 bacterium]|nr:glycerol-3-phosphate 1-O-acyltransferase PlsY [candidate division WOR-3 bacterium]
MNYLLAFVFGFLFGSIPWGYVFAKVFKKIDIREYGSQNTGATNVWRVCGKSLGIPVFLLDVAKGFLPVFLSKVHFGINPAIIAGLSAILGHAFTPWLKFKGGKGVATGLGVFIGLAPSGAAIAFGVWLILFLVFRWVSVASMGASAVLTILIFIWNRISPISFFILIIFLFVIFSHRANIKRLLKGKEPKFGKK